MDEIIKTKMGAPFSYFSPEPQSFGWYMRPDEPFAEIRNALLGHSVSVTPEFWLEHFPKTAQLIKDRTITPYL